MSLTALAKSLGKDFFQEAASTTGPQGQKTDDVQFFGWQAAKEGYEPNEADIKQRHAEMCDRCGIGPKDYRRSEKAMQLCRDTAAMWEIFADAELDPFSEYAPKVNELKTISGKAFGVGTVQNVWPVFYQSQIMEGILATPMLDRVVAQTVQVNGGTADHVGLTDAAIHRRLGESGEWARGVELNLSYTNAVIALKKFQGTLKASGEATRRARIPVFAAAVRRIGEQLGIDIFDFALDVLIAGDGTTLGGAATTVATAVSGSPAYSDFVSLLLNFTDGYEPTDALASATVLAKIFNMSEFKDPQAGFNFQRTGAYPTPLGWNLHRWDSTGASNYATTKLVVWQAGLALVQYNEGGVEQESDRIIENDYTMLTTRLYTGFGIWDRAAARVGTGWA